jgi:anti-sigma-K factor RskA
MNARELLPDYVLGLLSTEEKQAVEKYLEGSSTARAELQSLQQTLIKLSESAPSATPQTSFQDLQRRLISAKSPEVTPQKVRASKTFWYTTFWHNTLRDWRTYAVTASLVLAVVGFSWGYNARQDAKLAATEIATLNDWLAYGDLSMTKLNNTDNQQIGTVLISPRDYALFVLDTPPPKGKCYQAWGRTNGTTTLLATSEERLIPVKSEGFEDIGVSLEPIGGSPQPTQPLAGIPLD